MEALDLSKLPQETWWVSVVPMGFVLRWLVVFPVVWAVWNHPAPLGPDNLDLTRCWWDRRWSLEKYNLDTCSWGRRFQRLGASPGVPRWGKGTPRPETGWMTLTWNESDLTEWVQLSSLEGTGIFKFVKKISFRHIKKQPKGISNPELVATII